jgi:hypothetical protein
VRKVPVTTQRIEYEERVEPVRVKVLRYETETKTLQEPRTVAKWVPYESTRMVPETIVMRIPIDEYGQEIVAPPVKSNGATTVRKIPVESPKQKLERLEAATAKARAEVEAAEAKDNADEKAKSGAAQNEQAEEPKPSEAESNKAKSASGEAKDSDPTGTPKLDGSKSPGLNGPASPSGAGKPASNPKSATGSKSTMRIPQRVPTT